MPWSLAFSSLPKYMVSVMRKRWILLAHCLFFLPILYIYLLSGLVVPLDLPGSISAVSGSTWTRCDPRRLRPRLWSNPGRWQCSGPWPACSEHAGWTPSSHWQYSRPEQLTGPGKKRWIKTKINTRANEHAHIHTNIRHTNVVLLFNYRDLLPLLLIRHRHRHCAVFRKLLH